jgi:hypothetical protein
VRADSPKKEICVWKVGAISYNKLSSLPQEEIKRTDLTSIVPRSSFPKWLEIPTKASRGELSMKNRYLGCYREATRSP